MASSHNNGTGFDGDEIPLLPLKFTSPPVGKDEERSIVRFVPAKDDVEASCILRGLNGCGVRVAVLDTGIDATHPALRGRIDKAASRNFVQGGPNDYTDGNGHGTHCAGIIAAENRGAIMYGIAPCATLIAIKIITDNGLTCSKLIVKGIRHAIAVKADVISMSFGGKELPGLERFTDSAHEEYKVIQEALAAGIVIVAAAGNKGDTSSLNTINPPGAFGGIITVASHDDHFERSEFSSQGGELDFMAPGETFSTYARGAPYLVRYDSNNKPIYRPGRCYEALRGTSMACPLIAGLAALLVQAGRSRSRCLSPILQKRLKLSDFQARNCYEVRELLRSFADRPEEHHREDGYGALSSIYRFVKTKVSGAQLTVAEE